jgi:hypothetical protein
MASREFRIRRMRELGLAGTRLEFNWSVVERERGTFSWTRLDSILTELNTAGLGAYGMLAYTPAWARPEGTTTHHRPAPGGDAVLGNARFAHFAAEATRRYSDRIRRWEVWNEPNSPQFWIHVREGSNQGPDPADYVGLFNAVLDSIHAVDPGAEVASGGLASFGGVARELPDPQVRGRTLPARPAHVFLRQMIGAGLRPPAVGLHPYAGYPPGRTRPGETVPAFPDMVLDSVLVVLERQGMASTPVWVTEWGVNVQRRWSETDLERWFADAICEFWRHPTISVVTLYVLEETSERTRYGLLDANGRPTAAGRALERFLRPTPRCPA